MVVSKQLKNCEVCGEVTSFYWAYLCEFCRNKKRKHKNYIKSVHKELNLAVKYGRVDKPLLCEECHNEEYLEAHHDDYTKPLEVKWYCRSCHRTNHRVTMFHA